jgi:hypothetical protein
MDHLFCLRDSNPIQFFPDARRTLLPLIRTFVKFNENLPKAPTGLGDSDKERIRSDVGKLLSEIQMFDIQNKIDFGKLKYGQYLWEERTRLGREHFHELQWDGILYENFLEKHKTKQTW